MVSILPTPRTQLIFLMQRAGADAAPVPSENIPSLRTAYIILASAFAFLVIGSYATFFSTFHSATGIWVSLRLLIAPWPRLNALPSTRSMLGP